MDGKLTCKLVTSGFYSFDDGSSEFYIRFFGKDSNFLEKIEKKIILKNDTGKLPELPIKINVTVDDDDIGNIYPIGEKGNFYWKPLIDISSISNIDLSLSDLF